MQTNIPAAFYSLTKHLSKALACQTLHTHNSAVTGGHLTGWTTRNYKNNHWNNSNKATQKNLSSQQSLTSSLNRSRGFVFIQSSEKLWLSSKTGFHRFCQCTSNDSADLLHFPMISIMGGTAIQDPEPAAAEWDPAITHVMIYSHAFSIKQACCQSKCLSEAVLRCASKLANE